MILEKKVAQLLIVKKKTLALAESCSGGLLAHRLTNIPGSSTFLIAGLIPYSYQAKTKLLNISPKLIKQVGAVHKKTALGMAHQVRKMFKTDYGIGITGIAGPTGATLAKPVGLVFIAISSKKKDLCLRCLFKGTRKSIKTQTTTRALQLLRQFLDKSL